MSLLHVLRKSIHKIGIKEIARRSGVAASTVSRINAGLISPSIDVTEKISRAAGLEIRAVPLEGYHAPRLKETIAKLKMLKPALIELGVKHVTIFGSVARGEDRADSDIDLYVDYGKVPPRGSVQLSVEGRIIDTFEGTKVDIVSNLKTPKGRRLEVQIKKDGRRAF